MNSDSIMKIPTMNKWPWLDNYSSLRTNPNSASIRLRTAPRQCFEIAMGLITKPKTIV